MNAQQDLTCTGVLMVRPAAFGFNPQTAGDNHFQAMDLELELGAEGLLKAARDQFDQMARMLRSRGIRVEVIEDLPLPRKPDAVFPNNWLGVNPDGTAFLFPMKAPNRRIERRQDILEKLTSLGVVKGVIDLSHFEEDEQFLEGTGSMVPDRRNQVIFACLSERTHLKVLQHFAGQTGYRVHAFHATGAGGQPIYHTNVMMCLGQKLAIACLAAISDLEERKQLCEALLGSGREVLEISLQQMGDFAGNVLELGNEEGERFWVMSDRAWAAFDEQQRAALELHGTILHCDLSAIEVNGGSARCMLAEIKYI